MSSRITPVTVKDIRFLVDNHLPEAMWTFGGAMRFDSSLLNICNQLAQSFPLRKPARVAGCPACKWSLDWYTERRPMSVNAYNKLLEDYAAQNIGVVLSFDNPFITEDMLSDSYANTLLAELYKRDRVHRNAVCTASDLLAAHIRSQFPKFPVFCHANRLIAERNKRTAELYNKLLGEYNRVCLHPADATRPAITSAISAPDRCDIIINDPLPRNSAVRRDHLRLLADIRKDPYNTDLARRRTTLVERDGWHSIQRDALRQLATCNLTREESAALYAAGYRSYIVQGSQFRNEMTLLWDIFTCTLDYSPELNNKAALIANSIMATFGLPKSELPSGLKDFSFTNYE
ncbi:MAG: hypothetical protein IJ503_07200 [Akkermansia sp.]|nr:hypothetical protein [Akkermansia sp.]MBQ8901220.1 hypothetical protein [Akkermansia sp.]